MDIFMKADSSIGPAHWDNRLGALRVSEKVSPKPLYPLGSQHNGHAALLRYDRKLPFCNESLYYVRPGALRGTLPPDLRYALGHGPVHDDTFNRPAHEDI